MPEDCECRCVNDCQTAVEFCPLHAAAPRLKEALGHFLDWSQHLDSVKYLATPATDLPELTREALAALAAAEGRDG